MNPDFQLLPWDSNFFGYKVARISKPLSEIEDLNNTLKSLPKDITLCYLSSPKVIEDTSDQIDGFDLKYVDEKLTFIKELEPKYLQVSTHIHSYSADYPDSKLLDLAIQSGIHSRFHVDIRIGRDKFEKLYRRWMINSVSREIAEEVLVYKVEEEIAGMITLGEKNERSDIGIIAVDTQYRGKGVGKELMHAAENWSLAKGRKVMQVLTQGANKTACNFYKRQGYGIGKVEHFYHIWRKEKREKR